MASGALRLMKFAMVLVPFGRIQAYMTHINIAVARVPLVMNPVTTCCSHIGAAGIFIDKSAITNNEMYQIGACFFILFPNAWHITKTNTNEIRSFMDIIISLQ
jgi:hypothetical protein